ncbi:recombinase family protein [Aquibium sp. ELW1220]|uniref:recombinase family protein n=1 Tax=Aquibium sp. ELW1220 TaxID=2976766 RepID=UPI0025B197A6|nr:recombinase family protein [Aquibium sp. ELW1220]MDN2578728.1 recombinase family protein [Aquibium sp. ELW1220]
MPEAAKPLAYSYIRMSTDIQLKGDSLRRQQEASIRYAEQHGLQLVEDFKLEDIGVSAFTGANRSSGALGRFLELTTDGRIASGSYLLVESLDRISRQKIMESVPLFMEIIRRGINIVTLSDNHLYRAGETDLGELVYSIVVLSRAYEESKTKSIRVGAAWENKRRNIADKKLTKVCPAWLRLADDRKSFAVIEDRVEVVRRIFEDAEKGMGSYAIARRLNLACVPTFSKSNGWHESYVTKILTNRSVIGEFQPHRYDDSGNRIPHGEPIADYFPAVVTEDQFLRIQAARRVRRVEGAGRKGPEYRNLFTKIAKCEYCGSPMRFVHKGVPPKGGQYLKCTNAVRNLGCETKGWKYADFEASFLYFVREIDLAGVLQAAADKSERDAFEQKLLALDEKIRELEAKRDRIFDLLSDPQSTTDYVRRRLAECETELGQCGDERAHLVEKLADLAQVPEIGSAELIDLISDLQKTSGEDAFEKRAIVANRLRTMIRSLTLAVEGTRPKFKKAKELLTTADIDVRERQAILDHIEKTSIEARRYNRTFTVELADGITRRVILQDDDPTHLVAEVTNQSGNVTGSDRGRTLEDF